MKKMITAALAITMVAAMSTTAFAGTGNIDKVGGTQEIDVKAKYVDDSVVIDTYSVDVAWGAMEFTYTLTGDLTWNTETHQFDDSTSAAWSEKGNEVTVTNHSNLGVGVALDFTADAGYSTVAGSFSQDEFLLESAVGKEVEKADSKTVSLNLDGTLADSTTALSKIGSVTVTIK